MDTGERSTPGSVLLSVALSLLDRVTPELRAVIAHVSSDRVVARFLYDTPIDGAIAGLVSEAETYAYADLWATFDVEFRAQFLSAAVSRDTELDTRRGDVWVYRRYEQP